MQWCHLDVGAVQKMLPKSEKNNKKQKINEFVEETIASINVVSLISKGNAFPIKSPQDEKNNMKTFYISLAYCLVKDKTVLRPFNNIFYIQGYNLRFHSINVLSVG